MRSLTYANFEQKVRDCTPVNCRICIKLPLRMQNPIPPLKNLQNLSGRLQRANQTYAAA